jgi:PadR family transcriptional regulator PadR
LPDFTTAAAGAEQSSLDALRKATATSYFEGTSSRLERRCHRQRRRHQQPDHRCEWRSQSSGQPVSRILLFEQEPSAQTGGFFWFRTPKTVRSLFDMPIDLGYSNGMPNKEEPKADVLQGTLDLMVLRTLSTLGPLHGYQIAARLEQVSGGALRLNMGTLYPSLMRLEQRGFLRGEWGVTENNRKARFYGLTAAGRRRFASEKAEWERMVAIMQLVFGEPA